MGCNFVLRTLELLLQDLFSLLSFGELLPKDRVGAVLLLEVVDRVVMLLLLYGFLQALQDTSLFDELLKRQHFISSLSLTLLEAFHLLKYRLVIVLMLTLTERITLLLRVSAFF